MPSSRGATASARPAASPACAAAPDTEAGLCNKLQTEPSFFSYAFHQEPDTSTQYYTGYVPTDNQTRRDSEGMVVYQWAATH